MSKLFSIREATLDDARGVCTVRIQSWHESYQGIVHQEALDALDLEADVERYQKKTRTNPEHNILRYVATVDDQIVGFCIVGPNRKSQLSSQGEIYALYVLQAFKGRGVGRALWQRGVSALAEKGYVPYSVCVLTKNQPARQFYEAMNGIEAGTHSIDIDGRKYDKIRYAF